MLTGQTHIHIYALMNWKDTHSTNVISGGWGRGCHPARITARGVFNDATNRSCPLKKTASWKLRASERLREIHSQGAQRMASTKAALYLCVCVCACCCGCVMWNVELGQQAGRRRNLLDSRGDGVGLGRGGRFVGGIFIEKNERWPQQRDSGPLERGSLNA